jgi:hypothetical protein
MLQNPEFEEDFYKDQNQKMQERYSAHFKKWNLSWDVYFSYVSEKLKHNTYWIWVFLCGFEKFLQNQSFEKESRRKRLYKDADERIFRIIGDYAKIQDYIKSL